LEAGARFGRFEILSPIGAGGMGEVYRARDARLGREVALKLLAAAVADLPERRARLEREARALAGLTHPGIATLYEIAESEGRIALVMELVEGEDLAACLKRGPLPGAQAIDIALQIAAAIEHAHERGILHRDLKPSNVVLGGAGRVKLLDFGLAKIVVPSGESSEAETATTPAPTEAGVVMGTVPYMSPEQVRGEEVDRRTDVWAFGCVLYEMLTGRRAFPGGTRADTIASVLGREPDWQLLPPDTPPGVRRLLRRCLQKDSSERLRDMGDVGLELRDAQSDAGKGPALSYPRLGLPSGRLRTGIVWLAVLASFGAIGLATRRALAPTEPTVPGEAMPALVASPSPAPPALPSARVMFGIQHQPIGCLVAGQFPLVDAMIEPLDSVAAARVYFRSALSQDYYFVEMARTGGSFVGKLPKPNLAGSPITYYIVAYSGTPDSLIESGRSSEVSATVAAAPAARAASDPAARTACPRGVRIAPFGPPGAVSVYSAGGADLVFSLKDAFGLEDLVVALKDPNPQVRAEAARSLGSIGPETTRAITAAVARLRQDDPADREQAASDLAETGRRVTRQVMTGLVGALGDPESPVRTAAAEALGEIGPGVAAAVVALRRALKDPNAEVRTSATEALGSIGAALSPAIAALERESDEGDGPSSKAADSALEKIRSALSPAASPTTPPR